MKTTYKRGETVEWIRFAWLPTKSDDGKTYWFKKLKWKFTCDTNEARHPRVEHRALRMIRWNVVSVLPS